MEVHLHNKTKVLDPAGRQDARRALQVPGLRRWRRHLHKAATKAVEVLTTMAIPVELSDRDSLVKSASTSLYNKVVSQYSTLLALLAVDVVLSVAEP
jgi:phosphoribosylformylglycinamidine (FGAM) synthase PurS component